MNFLAAGESVDRLAANEVNVFYPALAIMFHIFKWL